jgi:hypothetical protein
VRWVELHEVVEDYSPGFHLLLAVLDMRQLVKVTLRLDLHSARISLNFKLWKSRNTQTHWLSVFIVVGDVGEVFAALAIDWVGESGMISGELRAVRENLIGEAVELANTTREPWDDFGLVVGDLFVVVISARDDLEVAALLLQELESVSQFCVGVRVALDHELVACE